jgi:hypothetical protein
MRYLALAACLVVFGLVAAYAAGEEARFPFVIPWNDATPAVVNVGSLNPAPLDASRQVTVKDGHFYDATGRRVRFVGTNITAGGAFPTKEDAEQVAAHLHKLGFNCVRLHHMDAAWADPNIFYISGGSYGKPTERLDPQSLDRLDYLIYQLKQNGIYVDINLHVSRQFIDAEGFPDTDRLPELGKVVGYFEPGMIARQKLYAKQLLDHRNPYTKLRYVEDPVVALVEITNEDSLLGSAGEIPALPEHYRNLLATGWNAFLKGKYSDTKGLLAAWNAGVKPPGENMLRNPRLADGTNEWTLEKHEGTDAQMTAEDIAPEEGAPPGRALHVSGLRLNGTDWHLQLHQLGLDLTPGETYTVSFAAKSSAPRTVGVNVRWDDPDWRNVGLDTHIELQPRWQRYTMSFTAGTPHPHHNRLSFVFGNADGDFSLADLSVRPGGGAVVLEKGQTLEAGTLPLPDLSDNRPGRDYAAYLIDVERQFTQGMHRYLKQDLGVKAAVACTQASYGGIGGALRESQLDWVDMHNYWQHPWFPNRPWDSNDYRIGNTPMVRDEGGGTLTDLARYRVAGKPFTVSEYDHPAPNEYAAEMVPMVFAYAAWQDWDGVFLFAYAGDDQGWDRDRIEGFFDQQSHPGKLAFVPSAAELFLRGALAPAPAQQTLLVPVPLVPTMVANGSFWNAWAAAGGPAPDFVGRRTALRFVSDGALRMERTGVVGETPLSWDRRDPSRALFTVNAPSYQSLVGFPGTQPVRLGPLSATVQPTPRGFAALTLASMDGKPAEQSRSLLLTIVDKVENAGLEWNADRTFAAHSWDHGPTMAEGVTAEIAVTTRARRATVYALDGTGKRVSEVPCHVSDGALHFTTGPEYKTIWYEVVAGE